MPIEPLVVIILGFLLCWVLVANNASTFLGPSVGGGYARYSTAVLIVSVGVLVGVFLEGAKLSQTITRGVLPGFLSGFF